RARASDAMTRPMPVDDKLPRERSAPVMASAGPAAASASVIAPPVCSGSSTESARKQAMPTAHAASETASPSASRTRYTRRDYARLTVSEGGRKMPRMRDIRFRGWLPSLMALAAASASCGPAPANLHDALQQLTQVYCEAEFRCCSSAQAQAKSGVGDGSHCSMAVVPLVVQFGVAAQSAIDKGLYTYDGSAAALCIDGIRGALSGCGGPAPRIAFDANPICISMLVGKL